MHVPLHPGFVGERDVDNFLQLHQKSTRRGPIASFALTVLRLRAKTRNRGARTPLLASARRRARAADLVPEPERRRARTRSIHDAPQVMVQDLGKHRIGIFLGDFVASIASPLILD